MGFVPKPILLVLRKFRNKSAAWAETNGTLISSIPLSVIQCDDADNMHLVPKHNLFDRLPLKDLDGEYRMEKWVPMSGTSCSTSFSDLCKTGKLSVNFNRNYAACIPKLSGRIQRSTNLTVKCSGKQTDLHVQDVNGMLGLLCIGVEDTTYSGTDFYRDDETSDPLVPQNSVELEIPPEPHTLPSEKATQSSDAAHTGYELGFSTLSKLELPWEKLSQISEITSSSLDTPHIQSAEDLSVMVNKPEQLSPVSVLEPLFGDASPVPADDTTKPGKPPLQPRRINFEDRSPAKSVKFHSDTITKTSIPSMEHTSTALQYTRKTLEVSELNWYKLALNWHCSTQMLSQATYTKMKSQKLTSLETRLLFDHINEVLQDTYHPYYGFYTLVSLSRRQHKPRFLTERNFIDQVIKIIEMYLISRQHQATEQTLVMDFMEKCETWIDIRRELEDMVVEIAEEVAEELVEEFMFEMWID